MPVPGTTIITQAINGFVIEYTVNNEPKKEIANNRDELLNKLNTLFPPEEKERK